MLVIIHYFIIVLVNIIIQAQIYPQNSIEIYNISDSVYTAWVNHYISQDTSAMAIDMVIDDLGNVYVTGYNFTPILPIGDYATVKYSSDGIEQWVALYNGPADSDDRPSAMVVDDSGNVYVTGYTYSENTIFDYATVKYNTNGNEVWVAIYDGPDNSVDIPSELTIDSSGNIYVTGTSFIAGQTQTVDYVTIKYNSDGVELWVMTYDGPANSPDRPRDITVDKSGNVYVTGISWGLGTTWDYATVKYDSNGQEQWVIRYDGPASGDDGAGAIVVDDSGYIYVTGGSVGTDTDRDYATVKYNSDGVEQWVARYDGPASGDDGAGAIVIDDSGYIYVTGGSDGVDTNIDYATVKYNSDGVEQWVARYDGPVSGVDIPVAMTIDDSGNIYVIGSSSDLVSGTNFLTIKYNAYGIEQWTKYYNDPQNLDNFAVAIAVDDSENVYIAGSSYLAYYSPDDIRVVYTTIKYIQDYIISIRYENVNISIGYQLTQNYPNPFNVNTEILYLLKNSGFVNLTVYDIQGRTIKTLVNEFQNSGIYSVNFNGGNISSGIYLYKLKAGNFIETKKMLLIR